MTAYEWIKSNYETRDENTIEMFKVKNNPDTWIDVAPFLAVCGNSIETALVEGSDVINAIKIAAIGTGWENLI